jgi:hypothetical protein
MPPAATASGMSYNPSIVRQIRLTETRAHRI